MRENTVNPRVNRDKNGFESVFGKFSDSNKRNTIIDFKSNIPIKIQ